jgi:N6-L-threonylcarbamoyladenine synthase
MKILAIETSCDDTCVAVIKVSGKKRPNFNVLSDIVSSQTKIHRKYGGVYPTLAKREHQKNLVPVLIKALKKARMLKKSVIKNQKTENRKQKLENVLKREKTLYKQLEKFLKGHQKPGIDLIAVTVGPGLEPCLWVGVNFAKAHSYFWNLPIITVNHLKAHIFTNVIKNQPLEKENFPAVCLVVSGGHTLLFLMKDFGKYKILGETRDDAAGECFDKTARILGLGYPGGPAIAAEATNYKLQTTNYKLKLPRPMINSKDYDFSFSGLKTAVLYNFKKQPARIRKSKQYIREMSKEIQQAVIDVLIKKTLKAARDYKAKTIILGGGVVANNELRKQFARKVKDIRDKIQILMPPENLCTDNAVMTAISGYFRWLKNKKGERWQDIEADANLRLK